MVRKPHDSLPMRLGSRPAGALLACLAAVALALQVSGQSHARDHEEEEGAPEFIYPYADQQEFWINSEPLSIKDFRGKPLLIEFWTFGCINCRRSIPWVKSLEERYAGRLGIVGVHTPEFEHEKDKAAVRDAVARLGVTHPVVIDNDFYYWKALRNRYWPAYYLVDKHGELAETFIGEVREGSEKAARIERAIAALL